ELADADQHIQVVPRVPGIVVTGLKVGPFEAAAAIADALSLARHPHARATAGRLDPQTRRTGWNRCVVMAGINPVPRPPAFSFGNVNRRLRFIAPAEVALAGLR